MKFELVDHLSLPGDPAKPNEDAFGYAARAAVVLDGATPLGESLMPGRSDAAWIAQFGARRLIAHLRESGDGVKALEAALGETQKSFRALRRHPPRQKWQMPCASMMLVTCADPFLGTDDKKADAKEVLGANRDSQSPALSFFWYGDCAALLKQGEGRFTVIGETFDARAVEAQRAHKLAQQGNLSPASGLHRPQIMTALRKARNRVNSAQYWLFSPSLRALSHVCQKRIEISDSAIMLLASDGFLALASDYFAYDAWALLEAACQKGLACLGEELREIEAQDRLGDRFPRFKKSDDATALLLRLS